MRIGLLTTSYPRGAGDVAGLFVRGFARTLVGRGHTVDVLAPEPPEAGAPPAEAGITVHWVPYLRPRDLQRTFYGAGVPDNLVRDPLAWLGLAPFSAALVLAAQGRVADWDALVSHWALPSALAAGLVRGQRRHVAVLHSADVYALTRLPGGAWLAGRVAESANELLFVSKGLRDAFLARLPARARADCAARAHVCPMGIETPVALVPGPGRRGHASTWRARQEARHALGLSPNAFVALALARLVPIKGHDVLLEAVRLVHGLTLLIAGDGPERAALERRARRFGLDARFVGSVTGEAKEACFAAADAFVLSSRLTARGRSEGTPTALLEALAAGLPCIATDLAGVREVVSPGRDALVVPPDDAMALAAALERLRVDAGLRRRLGAAARKTGAAYTWDALALNLDALVTGAPLPAARDPRHRALREPASRGRRTSG
jgi:glycosyltransferase involved in cell wall biosynthesis